MKELIGALILILPSITEHFPWAKPCSSFCGDTKMNLDVGPLPEKFDFEGPPRRTSGHRGSHLGAVPRWFSLIPTAPPFSVFLSLAP